MVETNQVKIRSELVSIMLKMLDEFIEADKLTSEAVGNLRNLLAHDADNNEST